jgi:Spy/CpxP family protein refolding chaperone
MRSTRLATAAVAAGAALLGWSTVSVAAIGDQLPASPSGQPHQQQQEPHHCVREHDHRPGV